MMLRWRKILGIISVSWLLVAGLANSNDGRAAEPADLLKDFARDQLIIVTGFRCIRFTVYVANDQQQRAQGLMYIRSMPADEGMIFLYPEPVLISMWMKNTLIPLDMIFIAADFSVSSIAKETEPMSETIIDSEYRVQAVLELGGGIAEYFGIREGDQIIFPAAPGT